MTKTKIYQLLSILSKDYIYQPELRKSAKTIPRSELIQKCQISELEFAEILETQNKNRFFKIYEIEPDSFCLFSQNSLYELIDDLLVLINGKLELKSPKVSIKEIMRVNDGVIRSYFSE